MSIYDEIKIGLEQAIDFEKGKLKAKTTTLIIKPVPDFSAKQIKTIRNDLGMTQNLFAQVVGVSKKTVEAWESGRNNPDGPARRMISILQSDPSLVERMEIVGN